MLVQAANYDLQRGEIRSVNFGDFHVNIIMLAQTEHAVECRGVGVGQAARRGQ